MIKKIFSVVLIIAIILVSMPSIVSASSFSVNVKAGTGEAKPGEEVTITLSLSNIDKGDKDGLNAISATMVFDSSVLTYVSSAATTGWSLQAYNTTNGTFALTRTNSDYITSSQDFMTFTFKVNDNTTVTSTEVKLTDISAAFGQESDITETQTITAANTSATLKIVTSTQIANTNTNTATNNTPVVTSTVINNGVSDKTIPQTGVSDIILPVIIVLGIISVISYIRYKNYKNI